HLYAPVFGGPESALSSILVPGLGQYKVQKKKGPYFLITAAAYGLVGTGIAKKIQSNNTYSDYLAASTPNEIASLKDAYQTQKRTGTALLAGGAVVWLADVAWVLLQGMRNKNAYQDIRKSTSLRWARPEQGIGLALQYQF
ncbi:MAG: hypothetical protein IT260_17860, partial [Saprospiraceae bacterium]|nr:hypothetical protein [Saprospiraceae bacterium]